MSPPNSSVHWFEIGFYSRYSFASSIAKPILTRPATTRRSSTWEVPLAKSVVACKTEGVLEVDSSAALCVQETRDVLDVDPFHEAELKIPEYPFDGSDSKRDSEPELFVEVPSTEGPKFDASEDNDVLRSWTTSRDVLVVDSTIPCLAPHIVITPASDTLSDLAIAWFNQPAYYQDASKLCLPPLVFTENIPSPSPLTASSPPIAFYPTPVFSPSRFNAMIESCSDERLIYFNVVIALRRQTVKAVAVIASRVAGSYRVRYDNSLPFSNIERPFSWSDPAEPILSASRFHRATLILDSPNPFRVPHIIINQPPPEDQWLTSTNAVNDPQDYGFGGESEYYDTSRFDEEGYRDWIEPIPEEDEDHCESYSSTLECYTSFDELPELDADSLTSVESPFAETPDVLDVEDFKFASERALGKRMVSSVGFASTAPRTPSYIDDCPLERPTCNPFEETNDADEVPPMESFSWADEEDELPPLDDEWYQSVIRRTEGVARA
ncbi:hypothetical protein J3R30DRAFT_2738334 [Lentinula aciculospora]|uniref:Uncharacterized protein n=1 Tax=Lentinula aciculospora TaxID=153920 RepID=A0A9W9AD43_9AGAR|nr:hypothetical protein J3R30DRAFT_2738334 [Lentinula aciculospora]